MITFLNSNICLEWINVFHPVQACICCEANFEWQYLNKLHSRDKIYLLSNGKYLANLSNVPQSTPFVTKTKLSSRIYSFLLSSKLSNNLVHSSIRFRVANIRKRDGLIANRGNDTPENSLSRQFSLRIKHTNGGRSTSSPVSLKTVMPG